jgi:hypothetical protein
MNSHFSTGAVPCRSGAVLVLLYAASANIQTDVAEPHYFYATSAPAPGKIFDAAPAPVLLYRKSNFFKRTKLDIKFWAFFICDFLLIIVNGKSKKLHVSDIFICSTSC